MRQADDCFLIELEREAGWWTAALFIKDPDDDAIFAPTGVISQGRTLKSAARNVVEAYDDLLKAGR